MLHSWLASTFNSSNYYGALWSLQWVLAACPRLWWGFS